MPQAAKLRADNFVPADLGRGEMHRKIQAGNKILLNAQLRHKERMPDILGVHQQVDFAVHRDGHFGGHDVVFRVRIVVRVQTKEILGWLR